jgi:hypothetical protein
LGSGWSGIGDTRAAREALNNSLLSTFQRVPG